MGVNCMDCNRPAMMFLGSMKLFVKNKLAPCKNRMALVVAVHCLKAIYHNRMDVLSSMGLMTLFQFVGDLHAVKCKHLELGGFTN